MFKRYIYAKYMQYIFYICNKCFNNKSIIICTKKSIIKGLD